MNLGLENLAQVLGTVEATPEGIAFELFDGMVSYDLATEEFTVAMENMEKADLYIEQLVELQVATEKYGVDEVIAVIGAEALLGAIGTISGQDACLEAFGEKFGIAYQKVKQFLAGLVEKLIKWTKQAVMYFDGTAKRLKSAVTALAGKDKWDSSREVTFAGKAENFIAALRLLKEMKGDASDDDKFRDLGFDPAKGYAENAGNNFKENKATLLNLGWGDKKAVISAANGLIDLLNGRSALLDSAEKVKAELLKEDAASKAAGADDTARLAALKARRTAIVNEVKKVNIRIKKTNSMSKQLLAVISAGPSTAPVTPAAK